jgi:hypothetical protein
VLEPAGDFGLDQKPLAARAIVGVVVEHLLERHFAVQLGIEGHEHGAKAAARIRPQDAKPLTVRGGCANSVARRTVTMKIGLG